MFANLIILESNLLIIICNYLELSDIYNIYFSNKAILALMDKDVIPYIKENLIFSCLGHDLTTLPKYYTDGDHIDYCRQCKKNWYNGFKKI